MQKGWCLIILMALIGLAGCAVPTTYHAYDGTDGYSDVQLNNQLYRINFRGNDATSKDAVQNMLLYRAAQISHSRRYPYFQVISRKTKHSDEVFTSPGESNTYGEKHYGYDHTYYETHREYTPPSETVFRRYNAQMTVRLLKHNNRHANTYNARTILNSMHGQINWPAPHNR